MELNAKIENALTAYLPDKDCLEKNLILFEKKEKSTCTEAGDCCIIVKRKIYLKI